MALSDGIAYTRTLAGDPVMLGGATHCQPAPCENRIDTSVGRVDCHSSFFNMRIAFQCPACKEPQRVAVSSEATALTCDECHARFPLPADDLKASIPRRCVICGCDDLWRQKDFPQRIG